MSSVKRSMPTSPPPDSTSAKKKAGFYSAEDLLLLEQQPQSGTGAGGISSNSGDSRERQLSITSQGDAGCCAIS